MTRDELALELGRIAQEFDNRRDTWDSVVEPDGSVGARIYTGTIRRDPRTGELKRFDPQPRTRTTEGENDG